MDQAAELSSERPAEHDDNKPVLLLPVTSSNIPTKGQEVSDIPHQLPELVGMS